LVLRGHLYIENELNNLLKKFIPNSAILKLNKQGFYKKLELALALDLIEKEHFDSLEYLNELRNNYAHNLKYKLSVNEINKLKELVKAINGFDWLDEEVIIGNKKGPIIDLKALIVSLHSILEQRASRIKKANPSFDLDKLKD
jgi:hypothetical protein